MESVERFLSDAEAAARRGERQLGLDLLLLALDTNPGDPAVLARAHAIRQALPEPVAGEARGRIASPADGAVTEEPSGESGGLMLPDLDDLLDDDEPFQLGGGIGAGFAPLGPDPAEVERKRLEREEAERQAERQQQRAARRQRMARRILWPLLVSMFLLLLILVVNPSFLGRVAQYGKGLLDPVAKVESALEEGRYAEARSMLREIPLTAQGARFERVRGTLLLAEGDTASGVEAWRMALERDRSWEFALDVAAQMLQSELSRPAAETYLLAFERGAPWEYWGEIAEALYAGGMREQAQRLYELRVQGAPEGVEVTNPLSAPDVGR